MGFSRMKMRMVWPEDLPKVRELMGMTEEGVRRDVATLKDWLRKQPHLGPLTGVNEDKWLENYLIMNKNSLERAKTNLDKLFSIRCVLPQMFQDRNFGTPAMDRFFANTCLAFMPGLTPEGNRIVVYSHLTDDAANFHHPDLVKVLLGMGDLLLAEGADRVSDVVIVDARNARLAHLAKYNLTLLRIVFTHAWKAYPQRTAAIHVINPPPFVEAGLNLFKPFLKQKLIDRIHIHNKVEFLKDHIPLASLPSDYGGSGPSCADMNKALQNQLIENRALLDAAAQIRSKEHLRPDSKNTLTSWSDLGTEGSFRKLSLD